MLRARQYTATAADNCNLILSAIATTSSILTNALDMAKWESGAFDVDKKLFPLSRLLRDVALFGRAKLSASSQVSFVAEGLDEIEPTWQVEADEHILKAAFTNLLSNAVKFTATGSVTLRVRFDPQFDPQGPASAQLTVAVVDTGRGLSQQGLARAMIPFAQIRTGGDARQGTGLGLSLTKAMIETGHGGKLTLASGGPGEGVMATATVALRWTVAQALPPSARAPPLPSLSWVTYDPAAHADVLCVDDSAVNRMVIVYACKCAGLTCEQAADGADAVAAMAARRFSLVTMDRQMPVMNGDVATTRARDAGFAAPIAMVSGDSFELEEEQALLAAGITAILTKTEKPPNIHAVLKRLSELKGEAAASRAAAAPAAPLVGQGGPVEQKQQALPLRC